MSDSSKWRITQRSPHKQFDGTLDVVRDGAKEPHSYGPGVWSNVQGDEKSLKRSGFRGWFKR
jgi:hypothetical protein